MSVLQVHQVPVLSDNYVYLIHCPETEATAVIDPAVADPVLAAADDLGWTITHILNTHHHGDHVGGNKAIQRATGCTIVGAKVDAHRIPGIGVEVEDGDTYMLGNAKAQVFFVPGHTHGHIMYWFDESDALFCGDTLFAMGCGRLTEGTAPQMWDSLSKFKALPEATKIYCAHEYTQANGRFALSVEPGNEDLIQRMKDVDAARARNEPTVPSTLGEEFKTNPFLRPHSRNLQETVGLVGASDVDVFAETRRRKDAF